MFNDLLLQSSHLIFYSLISLLNSSNFIFFLLFLSIELSFSRSLIGFLFEETSQLLERVRGSRNIQHINIFTTSPTFLLIFQWFSMRFFEFGHFLLLFFQLFLTTPHLLSVHFLSTSTTSILTYEHCRFHSSHPVFSGYVNVTSLNFETSFNLPFIPPTPSFWNCTFHFHQLRYSIASYQTPPHFFKRSPTSLLINLIIPIPLTSSVCLPFSFYHKPMLYYHL